MGRKLQLLASPQAIAGRKAREMETPEEKALRNLRCRLRSYGITVYEAEQLLATQSGGCAICGREIRLSEPYQANIDHSHQSGRVRGILCAFCNKGLKYYKHLRRLDSVVQAYLGEEED